MTEKAKVHRLPFHDLEDLTVHLNEEFVYGRGRKKDLFERYPVLRDTQDPAISYFIEDSKGIISHVCSLPLLVTVAGEPLHSNLVGMVYTREDMRGQGRARQVLDRITKDWREDKIDLGILFTAQPKVYLSSGWKSHPVDCFGKVLEIQGPDAGKVVSVLEANEFLEEMNLISSGSVRIHRRNLVHQTIPVPADSVRVALVTEGERTACYFGIAGNSVYIYEFSGALSGVESILRRLQKDYVDVFINVESVSNLRELIDSLAKVEWQENGLTMVNPISERAAEIIKSSRIYVPYLDRL